jgi:hypothetical protein
MSPLSNCCSGIEIESRGGWTSLRLSALKRHEGVEQVLLIHGSARRLLWASTAFLCGSNSYHIFFIALIERNLGQLEFIHCTWNLSVRNGINLA